MVRCDEIRLEEGKKNIWRGYKRRQRGSALNLSFLSNESLHTFDSSISRAFALKKIKIQNELSYDITRQVIREVVRK